jgi:hypothetical protein
MSVAAELARIRGLAMPAHIICENRDPRRAEVRARGRSLEVPALSLIEQGLTALRAFGRPATSAEVAKQLQQTARRTEMALAELEAHGRVTRSRRSVHRPWLWVAK